MTADGSDRSFGAPRFDVVLRGYDRRQVDEHISRLQRLMGRMRNDLDASRGQPAAAGPPTPAGGRMRPTPRPRPDGLPATGGERRRRLVHRPHARDPAGGGGGGRGDPGQGARRGPGRGGACGRRPGLRPGRGGGGAPATSRTWCASATRCWPSSPGCVASWRRLLSGPTTRITLPTQESRPDRREAGAGQPLPGMPGHVAGAPMPPTRERCGSGVSGRPASRPEGRTRPRPNAPPS